MPLGEEIDKGETIVILAFVAVGAYLLYTAWDQISDWLNNLLGIDPSTGNSYSNAAKQTITDPVGTIKVILGYGQGTTGKSSTTPNLPTGGSSATAYSKIGASGQMWNCTGPSGASNDVCFPVDASGNSTGPAVQAANAN